MEKVVLAHVFQVIPTPVRAWLMWNRPSSLTQAAAYLENYFLTERAMRPEAALPDRAGERERVKGMAEEPLLKGSYPPRPPALAMSCQPLPSFQPLGGWEPLAISRGLGTEALRGEPELRQPKRLVLGALSFRLPRLLLGLPL